MNRHAWALENLGSYLAGGLSTDERYEIQELVKTDAEVAAALAELQGIDERMRTLFASAKPPVTLEDRVIRSLRQTHPPTVYRGGKSSRPIVGMALAASLLLLILIGFVASDRISFENRTTFVGATKHEDPLADGVAALSDQTVGGILPPMNGKVHHGANVPPTVDYDDAERETVGNSKPGLKSPATVESFDFLPSPGYAVPKSAPDGIRAGDESLKRVWTINENGAKVAGESFANLGGVGGGGSSPGMAGAGGLGRSEATRDRSPAPKPPRPAVPATVVAPTSPPSNAPSTPPSETKSALNLFWNEPPVQEPKAAAFRPGDVFRSPDAMLGDKAPQGNLRYNGPMTMSDQEGAYLNQIYLGATVGNKNGDKDLADPLKREQDADGKRGTDLTLGEKASEQRGETKAGAPKIEPSAETKPETKPEAKIDPKQSTASPVRRVIIRSGDIDFEVDSFDAAVATVYKLIGQTKGGIVATTNSDKLANGKMRGVVVVRMPPEELDDFVLALRRDLGKNGELKGQKIGSQDVTKHYTDLEGELRGLRISEERLIGMLKETKAQLKDLLAVETQLATTRTKLEKIEGELRYYANLAAMSTLTINLYEKEIRVAAGIIESERVQAGIEAEDVDKAFQEAKAAIDELKGRVFKSELKQSAAGQFNAILQFEIAPEQTGLMRDRLKQVGTIARLEIDRVQRVEGGGSPSRESKVKRGDTQFLVSIYNLANVTPRETVQLLVVSNDVQTNYRKLRDLIGKLKGTLRDTSLQNVDAQKLSAVLDFDIRRADELTMQTALGEAGEALSRSVVRAQESDNVTDTRIRYRVKLESVGGISPRESNTVSLAAVDVPASFRKVRDAVLKAKGHIRHANLAETDANATTASLQFDVMRADEAALNASLLEAGETLSRKTDRRPDGETVTDAKVGFVVTMVSVASLAARETTTITIAVPDVPDAFVKIKAVVGGAKSQVRAANLNETDRNDMSATLDFDVLRADEAAVNAALTAAGEPLSRRVDRQSGGSNITDSKVAFTVSLVSLNKITPRETRKLRVGHVGDLDERLKAITASVKDVGGKIALGPSKGKLPTGQVIANITYQVPLASTLLIADEVKRSGKVLVDSESKDPSAPDGKLAIGVVQVTLETTDPLVPGDEGFVAQVRNGLSVSLRGLSVSASWLVVAVLFVGPWVMLLLALSWIVRRLFFPRNPTPPPEPANTPG